MKLYVASSWRNKIYPQVVEALRADGHHVYDFRDPSHTGPGVIGAGGVGFSWKELPGYPPVSQWTGDDYKRALTEPCAQEGFATDWSALNWCDACVLVLPCGRSAHLEAGYAIGTGRSVFILFCDGEEPELMYLAARGIALDVPSLLSQLRTAQVWA